LKGYKPLVRSYARQAESYDRRWRRYNEATLQATTEAMPWGGLRHVLDVGCGTGLLEQDIQGLRPETQIIGIDIAPAMLNQARRKFGADAPVFFVNAVAENLPFASGSFDAVVCANSFHCFRQPSRVLSEFRRLLCPGGWLVLTDWCDDYLACKVCNWVLQVVDRAHFRMYGMRQCRELLTHAGFHVDLARRFKIDWLWGLMTHRARA
jgi:ubiquinone/menaquinone biosynthesis C-methylase UbiE